MFVFAHCLDLTYIYVTLHECIVEDLLWIGGQRLAIILPFFPKQPIKTFKAS